MNRDGFGGDYVVDTTSFGLTYMAYNRIDPTFMMRSVMHTSYLEPPRFKPVSAADEGS